MCWSEFTKGNHFNYLDESFESHLWKDGRINSKKKLCFQMRMCHWEDDYIIIEQLQKITETIREIFFLNEWQIYKWKLVFYNTFFLAYFLILFNNLFNRYLYYASWYSLPSSSTPNFGCMNRTSHTIFLNLGNIVLLVNREYIYSWCDMEVINLLLG